jgi:hypothetical protein
VLLVDSQFRCSFDVSVAVTDASVSEVDIFILLSLAGGLINGLWSCRGERLLHCGMLPKGGRIISLSY